jgi:hypothetical protein
MENPKKGDKVLHRNGYTAKVIKLGSIVTFQGLATTYTIKFLEGLATSAKCLRDDFTFSVPDASRAH